jgi:tRNA(Ile)-lysidine synthase
VLPFLRRENANIAETLIRAAEVLAADEDFLAARAAEAAARVTREATPRRVVFDRAALRELEPAMLRRVILGALIQVAEGDTSFEARHILAAAAYAAGERTGGGMHVPGGMRVAATRHDLVIVRRESGVRPRATELAPLALPVPGWVDVPGTPWRVGAQLLDAADSPAPGAEMAGTRAESDAAPGGRAYLDADLVGVPLTVGRWRPGDRFHPLGMARAKRLQDFFVDAKVPRDERAQVPVVWGPAHIIWVAGHRIDDRVRVRLETRRVLVLRLTRSDAIWHTEGSAEPAP